MAESGMPTFEVITSKDGSPVLELSTPLTPYVCTRIEIYIKYNGGAYPTNPQKELNPYSGESMQYMLDASSFLFGVNLIKCIFYGLNDYKITEEEREYFYDIPEANRYPVIYSFTAEQLADAATPSIRCHANFGRLHALYNGKRNAEYFIYANGEQVYNAKITAQSEITRNPTIRNLTYGTYTLKLKVINHAIINSEYRDYGEESYFQITLEESTVIPDEYSLHCVWSEERIADASGNELICANYPHISSTDFNAFCAGVNTVRRAAGLANYSFTPVSAGDAMSYLLFNEIINAINDIFAVIGSESGISPMSRNGYVINQERISNIENALNSIAAAVCG